MEQPVILPLNGTCIYSSVSTKAHSSDKEVILSTQDYTSGRWGSLLSRADRHGASPGLVLGQDLLVEVGALLSLLELALDLPELGKVEGGDLLGLLNLPLVGLDLEYRLM